MPPLTLTYCPMLLRCLTLGGGAADAAVQGMSSTILHSFMVSRVEPLFTLSFILTPPIIFA